MKTILIAAAAASVLLFVGCVSYDGIAQMGDDLADESNQVYASAAQQDYLVRMKAPPRPVVIREAPGMSLFLAPSAVGHPLCQDLNIRKELAVVFKSQLRDKVAGLKDFRLVEESMPVISVVAEGESAPPQNYLMTYNIVSLDLNPVVGGVVLYSNGRRLIEWNATAKVEVRLFKPNGTDCIFSFIGDGIYVQRVEESNPPNDLLIGAVSAAVNHALADYVVKFGPPIFVTDTCQNGRFVRLSVGSKFGVRSGQKVEFYRNRVRPGLTGGEEVSRQVVGTGIVGARHAPVEDDGAWVFVNDYHDDRRTVFRWTSARILSSGKARDGRRSVWEWLDLDQPAW